MRLTWRWAPPRRGLRIALLILFVSFGLGFRCSAPGMQRIDLGHGLTLRYWPVEVQRVSPTELVYVFEAKLYLHGRGRPNLREAGETLVSVASDDPATVVEDAGLRFPAGPGHGPSRSLDHFVVRQDRSFPFHPASLRFRALDRFGGALDISAPATGRFYTTEIDGRHWLITPDGHAFFSSGLNHITFHGDYSPPIDRRLYHEAVLARYGTEAAWAAATEDRLRSWNINTVGAWSNDHNWPTMPYTLVMSLHDAAPAVPGWPTGQTGKAIRDYFDPAFEANISARTGRAVGLCGGSLLPRCLQ